MFQSRFLPTKACYTCPTYLNVSLVSMCPALWSCSFAFRKKTWGNWALSSALLERILSPSAACPVSCLGSAKVGTLEVTALHLTSTSEKPALSDLVPHSDAAARANVPSHSQPPKTPCNPLPLVTCCLMGCTFLFSSCRSTWGEDPTAKDFLYRTVFINFNSTDTLCTTWAWGLREKKINIII